MFPPKVMTMNRSACYLTRNCAVGALIGMFFWETGVILCAFYARCNAKPPLPFQNTKKTRVILSPFYPPLPKLSERHHAKTPKKTMSS
jgi:hypothetical protein